MPYNPSDYYQLWNISAAAADDVWAVGSYRPDANGDRRTLTMHWNGSAWSIVPSPNNGSSFDNNELDDVAALSPTDAWAVGYCSFCSNGADGVLLHWDGAEWQSVSDPLLEGTYLYAIDALSPSDIWVAGDPPSNAAPVVLHWDGSQWTNIPVPDGTHGVIHGLAELSPDDVWAVGEGPGGTLAMQWDGLSWTVVPTPNPGSPDSYLVGVSGVSPNDIWVAGFYYADATSTRTLIMHWDGQTWSLADGPNPGTYRNYLYGVEAIAPDNAWATGGYGNPDEGDMALILHWDGQTWTQVPAPRPGPSAYPELFGVTSVSANDVWTAGDVSDTYNSYPRPWSLHYTGACATATPTATVPTTPTATATAMSTSTMTYTAIPSTSPTSTDTPALTTSPTPASTNTPLPPAASPTLTTIPQPNNTPVETATPGATTTPCSLTLSDVPEGSPFYTYVRCLACRAVISGYADGSFRPYSNITRGQIAKVVSNAAGIDDDVTGRRTYADVPPTHTFWQWIERLTLQGAMGGYSCGQPGEPCDPQSRPYFRPSGNATRGQLSKIVANAASFTEEHQGQTFADVLPTHTFYLYIARLASRGILGGYECGGPDEPCDAQQRPYFRPGNNITRGQAAKVTANTFYPDCSPR